MKVHTAFAGARLCPLFSVTWIELHSTTFKCFLKFHFVNIPHLNLSISRKLSPFPPLARILYVFFTPSALLRFAEGYKSRCSWLPNFCQSSVNLALSKHSPEHFCAQTPSKGYTNSMGQSPSWEASMSSATQEISRIFKTRRFIYRIYKSPPPVCTLNQIDPVYVLPSNLSKTHFNIILPSTPGSSKWFLPSSFPTKTLYAFLPIGARCSAHQASRLDHPNGS